MADQYEFLSPDWIAAAKALRDESEAPAAPPSQSMRANLVVTEVPFDATPIQAHVDTTSGEIEIEEGHLDGPDLTITVDSATAKSIFVGQDIQAGMGALLAGKIKIDGDMMKLMTLQMGTPDPSAQAFAQALKDLTL